MFTAIKREKLHFIFLPRKQDTNITQTAIWNQTLLRLWQKWPRHLSMCLPVFMVLLAVSALKSSGGKNRFLSSPKGMPSLLPAPGPQANDKTLGMPPNYRNLTGKGRNGNRAPFLLVQRTEPHWSQSSVENEYTGVRSLGSQRKRPRNLVQETDQA